MAKNLPVGEPLGYLGIKERNPPDTYTANRAPTVDDYRYNKFDLWLDASANDLYQLVQRSGPTAVWLQIGAWVGSTTRLEADDGTQAVPVAGIVCLTANNGLITTAAGNELTYQFAPVTVGFTGSQREYAQNAIQTTDNTVTDIISIPLATGEMVSIDARINALRDDYTEALFCKIFVGARRQTAGNVTVINYRRDYFEDSAGSPNVTILADIANQSMDIRFTGEVGKTYNVVTSYEYFKTLTNA
jgi:hypothetical protein